LSRYGWVIPMWEISCRISMYAGPYHTDFRISRVFLRMMDITK
jgi:hypothetical protein